MLANLLVDGKPDGPGEIDRDRGGFFDKFEGPGALYGSRYRPRLSNGGVARSAYSSGDSTTGG